MTWIGSTTEGQGAARDAAKRVEGGLTWCESGVSRFGLGQPQGPRTPHTLIAGTIGSTWSGIAESGKEGGL